MTMRKKQKRVLVAMSGGVDSSVSASLLLDQGYDVVGVTMQVWDYSQSEHSSSKKEEGYGTCCSSVDVEDARAVCQHLNIPFYVLNCEDRFQEQVIDRFMDSYLNGRTPVPCVDCNTYLKFGHLVKKMKELECEYLATGHYAQIRKNSHGLYQIYQSADDWKDQTYFLFTVPQSLISSLMFPIGGMDKQEVRKIAYKKGLHNVFGKKDSTGLCFVGSGKYSEFIKKRLNSQTTQNGVIRKYPTKEVIGTHTGLYQFTYGQRKGLGLSSHQPLYVIKIDIASNTLWVGEEKYLYSNQFVVEDWNWLDKVTEGERLKVKIRFHHPGCWARIYQTQPNRAKDKLNQEKTWKLKDGQWVLKMEQSQKAVTPGQAAVLYRGNQLIGGGRIV